MLAFHRIYLSLLPLLISTIIIQATIQTRAKRCICLSITSSCNCQPSLSEQAYHDGLQPQVDVASRSQVPQVSSYCINNCVQNCMQSKYSRCQQACKNTCSAEQFPVETPQNTNYYQPALMESRYQPVQYEAPSEQSQGTLYPAPLAQQYTSSVEQPSTVEPFAEQYTPEYTVQRKNGTICIQTCLPTCNSHCIQEATPTPINGQGISIFEQPNQVVQQQIPEAGIPEGSVQPQFEPQQSQQQQQQYYGQPIQQATYARSLCVSFCMPSCESQCIAQTTKQVPLYQSPAPSAYLSTSPSEIITAPTTIAPVYASTEVPSNAPQEISVNLPQSVQQSPNCLNLCEESCNQQCTQQGQPLSQCQPSCRFACESQCTSQVPQQAVSQSTQAPHENQVAREAPFAAWERIGYQQPVLRDHILPANCIQQANGSVHCGCQQGYSPCQVGRHSKCCRRS